MEHLAANFPEVDGDQTRAKRGRKDYLHSSGNTNSDDNDVALCLLDV